MSSSTSPVTRQYNTDDLYTLDNDGEIQHHGPAPTSTVPQALPAVEEVDEPINVAMAVPMVRLNRPPVPKKPKRLRQMRSIPVLPSVSEILEGYHAVTRKQSLDLPRPISPAPPESPLSSESPPRPSKPPPARYHRSKKPPSKEGFKATENKDNPTSTTPDDWETPLARLRCSRSLSTLDGMNVPSIRGLRREPPLPPTSLHQPQNSTTANAIPINLIAADATSLVTTTKPRLTRAAALEAKALPKPPRTLLSWKVKIRRLACRWRAETCQELEADYPDMRDRRIDEQNAPSLGETIAQSKLCPNGLPGNPQLQRAPARPVTTFLVTRVIEYYAPGGRQQCDVRVPEGRLYN